MPGKARVHELAKELGLDSKTILTWLKNNGEFVKSASSTVEAPIARKLRAALSSSGTPPHEVRTSPAPSPTGTAGLPAAAPVPPVPPAPRAPAPPQAGSARGPMPPAPRPSTLAGVPSTDLASSRYSVDRLSSWDDAVELARQAKAAHERGERLVLDCSQTAHVYPNGCVPAAAAIQDFRAAGLDVVFAGQTSYVRTSALRNPIEASDTNLQQHDVFNRVWTYLDPNQASEAPQVLCRSYAGCGSRLIAA